MERKFAGMEIEHTIADLGHTFVVRRDIFPSQLPDGRYVLVREPLTQERIRLHLQGDITLGSYVLNQDSRSRFMVLDADTDQDFANLKQIAQVLSTESLPSYLEQSRRGGHLWLFFKDEKTGADIRRFGKGVQQAYNLDHIELFPKQDVLADGPGSLIRLPFGVHRLTGKRYPFIHPDGSLLAHNIRGQISILAQPKTVPDDVFLSYQKLAPSPVITHQPGEGSQDALWGKIKERASAIDFIGAFVPLKRTATGGVGKCPFHQDDHDSFGVNAKGNYWNCFAGCGGGTIIDFWMKWRGIEFSDAVNELADLLGVPR